MIDSACGRRRRRFFVPCRLRNHDKKGHAMRLKQHRCENCRHWDRLDRTAVMTLDDDLTREEPLMIGECRRHPPQVVSALIEVVYERQKELTVGDTINFCSTTLTHEGSVWPVTWDWDSCGDFALREPPRVQGDEAL
jgi:hypothetical protein